MLDQIIINSRFCHNSGKSSVRKITLQFWECATKYDQLAALLDIEIYCTEKQVVSVVIITRAAIQCVTSVGECCEFIAGESPAREKEILEKTSPGRNCNLIDRWLDGPL
ncbi:hypothetical protein CBL_00960 [Carabus blaptoides fortunei]